MTKLHLDHTSSTEAIDNYTSTLTSVIQTTIIQNVPQIEVKTHSTGIDKTTQDLITEKKLRKLWQRTRIQHYKTEYNKLNNTIKHRIKTSKTKNWHNICNDLELTDNQDNTWHQLKKILKLNKPHPTFPTLITYDKDNNKIRSTTTEQKIDTLTSTFENIFTHDDPPEHYNINFKEQIAINLKLNEKLINTLPTISPNYLTHKYAISTKLIENTIDKLNTKKAPGYDKITNKTIKHLKPTPIPILHPLRNICKYKGYHPKIWKMVFALLFNKPNKPRSNPSNYRPISLISHLSKILEKIITTQIYHWAETNNILNKEQSGFRKNKSTTDKLFQLTQTISQAKKQRRPSSAIFLDVEKAFDKVWHDGLIHKLLFLNTPLHLLRYINNYITDRSMSFAINSITSPSIALNY